MSVARLIQHRALAILWSSGRDAPVRERIRMGSEAMGIALAPDWIARPAAVTEAACELLARFGHACDASREWFDVLPELVAERPDRPVAGDAVRIDGDGRWMGVERGQTLVLSDLDGVSLRIGRCHHRVTEGGMIVMTGGGPASIGAIDTSVLRATAETTRVPVWRNAGIGGAGDGVDYMRRARLWLWDGCEAALDHAREAA
jgi:hypothetical protein